MYVSATRYLFISFENQRGTTKKHPGRAHWIPDHGCKIYGRIPFPYPSDINADDGESTYNSVPDGCGSRSS